MAELTVQTGLRKHDIIGLVVESDEDYKPERLAALLSNKKVLRRILEDLPSPPNNPYQTRAGIERELNIDQRQLYIDPETGEMKVYPRKRTAKELRELARKLPRLRVIK